MANEFKGNYYSTGGGYPQCPHGFYLNLEIDGFFKTKPGERTATTAHLQSTVPFTDWGTEEGVPFKVTSSLLVLGPEVREKRNLKSIRLFHKPDHVHAGATPNAVVESDLGINSFQHGPVAVDVWIVETPHGGVYHIKKR